MAIQAALVPLARTTGQVLASAAPALRDKAIQYVNLATTGRVAGVDAAKQYALASKNGLATVATGLVTNGLNPNRIFTDDVMNSLRDAEIRQLAANLRTEFIKTYGAIDAGSLFQDVQHDPTESAARQLAAETIAYIRRRCLASSNDDKTAREFHAKLRLFINMSDDMLNEGLKLKASNA